MADTPSKPGTACIGCRRRKLKCTREPDGCGNCLKSDLPCVYPAPETGVKRKRGPYKKDKPPRERHLEDLVKYLEPRAAYADHHEDGRPDNNTPSRRSSQDGPSPSGPSAGDVTVRHLRLDGRGDNSASNSEDLVKDALIALTQSSNVDREPVPDHGASPAQTPTKTHNDTGGLGQHPPARRVFEYWHLFISRVDPLTKVVHRPTFSRTLFASIDNLRSPRPAVQALLFAVYYAAVSTCTSAETRRRFGESRDVLLQRYGRTVEASLADNYGMPELESLQAIVLYVTAIRREDNIANVRALFSLGVRMGQMMGLNEDPPPSLPPLEAEIRRRLWWHICGLESRGAEEGATRTTSLMQNSKVALPSNLFDFDWNESSTEQAKPRVGITDMTFILVRFRAMQLLHNIVSIRLRQSGNHSQDIANEVKMEQRETLQQGEKDLQAQYVQYFDASRPYDWMCMRFLQIMLIKARLIIDYPLGQVPNKQMSTHERFDLLRASVDIIAYTHNMNATERKGMEPWLWYVRGWTQWHSLAIVIAELGQCTNRRFSNHAWGILDPILARWDKVYSMKREEASWDHVNALIERARQMRQQILPPSGSSLESMPQTAPAAQYDSTTRSTQREMPANTMMGLSPTPRQATYPVMDYTHVSAQSYAPPVFGLQHPSALAVGEVPFHTGCAPLMPGFDAGLGDFGAIESLGGIDFSAFNSVFGDMSWDLSSQSTDWSMDGFNM